MRSFTVLAIILLTGCSAAPPASIPPADTTLPPDVPAAPQYASHGSIYRDDYMLALFSDRRAYREGDILTVMLNERTMSSKSADSAMDKNSNWDVGVPLVGNLNTSDLALQMDSQTGFNGESSASQQNFLSGAITVRVIQVYTNGDLYVKGKKQISLNQGDEFLELQGIVRPQDIDVANRVSSQRIADAQISYQGTGLLADANQPGWLTQLFTRYLNPF